MRNKKAQQEIIGFVIIVVIIAVVGVIFLGLNIRNSIKKGTIDAEISNFLSSSIKITTPCIKGNEPNYRNLGEVAEDCFDNAKCLDNKESCEVLNSSYSEMLAGNWKVGGPIKAYRMKVYYEQEENRKPLTEIESGNWTCSSTRTGEESIMKGDGDIIFLLELCS
jgi:hypothetical protein